MTDEPPSSDDGSSGRRFRIGVLWNYLSLAILGVSGIGLNVCIGLYYDAATLGAFNQVLAAYIVASMLASGGLNFSVLRALAEHRDDPDRTRTILLAALLPVVLNSALVSALFWLLRGTIAGWMKSDALTVGISAITPGLFFFAINKVLLAAVNGLDRMRAFAVYQALRYVLVLAGLLLWVDLERPGAELPGIFSLAEGILFGVLFVEVSMVVPWWKARTLRPWLVEHLRFGIKAAPSGMLFELNSRVDVLLLGWFLDDASVGIYSFAALFAEGFFQVIVVLQNNYNPVLARQLAAKEGAEVERMSRVGRKYTYLFVLPVAALSIAAYPVALYLLTNQPEFASSHLPFALLMSGIALAAGYLPFQNALSMANLPGWHTVFMMLVVAINAAGNLLLIPRFGIDGSAAATGLAFVASAILLRTMVRRLIGVRL